jgi:AraC family transcriptional regulator, transcriptional activator of pobA
MERSIPTYDINNLSGEQTKKIDVFFANDQINFKNAPLNIPYRSNYFGIGLCLDGQAILKANLETYTVKQHCIITMSPQIVKQWVSKSDDYQTLGIFFSKAFLIQNNINILNQFSFFDATAKHVSVFSESQSAIILKLLYSIREKLMSQHIYKNEITRSLINVLLYEIGAVYNERELPSFFKQTRSMKLTEAFKTLVNTHFMQERSVKFYADSLFVTPKHLTETIKAETGKSAGEWIDEMVILEAKILLQDTTLSVSNIADALHFTDQSTFGKFFKNITDRSPVAYRQTL